jgi:hypothetical protein
MKRDFGKSLQFPHADVRPFKKFENISHKQFLQDANIAVQNKCRYRGKRGICPLFDGIGFTIDDVCWDPFHACMLLGKYTIALFKGYYIIFIIIVIICILLF